MGKIMVNGENYSGSEIVANPTLEGGEPTLNSLEIDGDKYALGGGGGGVNYSTTEQDTGLKWVDGKTIYQKTFLFNNLTTGENVLELGNYSDFDVIIDYEFTCIRNNNDRYVNIGLTNVWGEATISVFNFRNVDNKLKVSVTSGYYAASDFYITIRYTKPTV